MVLDVDIRRYVQTVTDCCGRKTFQVWGTVLTRLKGMRLDCSLTIWLLFWVLPAWMADNCGTEFDQVVIEWHYEDTVFIFEFKLFANLVRHLTVWVDPVRKLAFEVFPSIHSVPKLYESCRLTINLNWMCRNDRKAMRASRIFTSWVLSIFFISLMKLCRNYAVSVTCELN